MQIRGVPLKILANRALTKYGLKKPVVPWLQYPMTVQIDTINSCGPKDSGIFCEYCYPQDAIVRGEMCKTEMSMEWIKWIQQDIAQNMPHLWDGFTWPPIQFVCYFLNGDPQNELRLLEILENHHRLLSWLPTQIFTSATKPERMDLFCNPYLDWVCVTLSAPNAEVYKKVHRGNKFNQVLKSMNYLTEHCYSHQKLEVHYVVTENNVDGIRDWWNLIGERFPRWNRIISPLVKSQCNLPSVKAMGNLTLEMQEKAIAEAVGKAHFWDHTKTGYSQPCVLWGNAAITAQGHVLQCCNWDNPENWNYGMLTDYMNEGRSLKDYWLERLANKQRNGLCRACNLRHPQYKSRLDSTLLCCKVKDDGGN